MPFLIQTNQPKHLAGVNVTTGAGISWADLLRYRENLEKRVASVWNTNRLDHKTDLREIEVSPAALKSLIEGSEDGVRKPADDGDYLVGHYYCEPKENGYTNLNVALCIKKKRTTGDDDTIVNDFVINTNGDQIKSYHRLFQNYRDRRQEIVDGDLTSEFDADKEGRGHLVNPSLRYTIKLLCEAREKLYLYFILDEDGPANMKNLSVVLTDQQTDFDTRANGPIAYDHGTQCCPLN